jgi:tetratricopeptide (TPR) repeat protein
MASEKSVIVSKIQSLIEQFDWPRAIAEMEKLFEIERDPHVKVWIGDVSRKLRKTEDAIGDYVQAAELFAERGFVEKALAQLNLVLRIDATNQYARLRREKLRSCRIFTNLRREPTEYHPPQLSEQELAPSAGTLFW